jgi:nitroreductase
MLNIIKKIIPRGMKDKLNEYNNKRKVKKIMKIEQDRFLKFGFGTRARNFSQMEAKLTKEYHSLEKGLSYKNLRLNFGQNVLKNVIDMMYLYRELSFPLDTHVYQTALSTLSEYIEVHSANGIELTETIKHYDKLKEGSNLLTTGGVHHFTHEEIKRLSKSNFENFSNSRHSIRDYSSEPVDYSKIEKALDLAKNTPSACNRQSWKIRIIEEPKMKKAVQNNQNGNRGFGDYVDKFILITADVSYYDKARERNQANIDGGMYAMNLLYALHYNDIAAVPLSASLTLNQETNLRNLLKISESEVFIMFIGIGNYIDEFKVPKSDRREYKYIKY